MLYKLNIKVDGHMNSFLGEKELNNSKAQAIFDVLVDICFENVSNETFFERVLMETFPMINDSQRGVFLHYKEGNCFLVSYEGYGHKSVYKSRAIIGVLDFLPNELRKMGLSEFIEKKSMNANWKNLATHVESDSSGIYVHPFYDENELRGVLILSCSEKDCFSEDTKRVLQYLSKSLDKAYSIYRTINNEKEYRKALTELLIQMNEMHEPYLLGHCKRVSKLCQEFGSYLGMGSKEIEDLSFAALVHESGKLLIDEKTLHKRIRLNDSEKNKIKMYPMIGNSLLTRKPMDKILKIVRSHHERWDGAGYPDNLEGEDIPYPARILSIIDAFDSMTHDRPYKSTKSLDEAVMEIKNNSGTQFDPELSEFFLEMIETIPNVLKR